jgi:hypothetical protein
MVARLRLPLLQTAVVCGRSPSEELATVFGRESVIEAIEITTAIQVDQSASGRVSPQAPNYFQLSKFWTGTEVCKLHNSHALMSRQKIVAAFGAAGGRRSVLGHDRDPAHRPPTYRR